MPRQLASATFAAAIALLGGLALAPLASSAQPSARPAAVESPGAPLMLEQYLSRAELDPAIVGTPASLGGAGARLLRPLGTADAGDPGRLALGAFATYARHGDRGLTAWHYGAQADLRLASQPLIGRIDPLLSLGVGALRTSHASGCGTAAAANACGPQTSSGRARSETAAAVSPALGLRVALLPGLAVRSEVRDVIVYRGAPRHSLELATGVSLARWRGPR
jgi:hypothetical protein